MNQTAIEAGRRVAEKLQPAERLVDETMLAWSGALIAIISAGREVGQGQYENQKLVDRAVETIGSVNALRRNAVRVHSEIARHKTELGLDPVNFGCTSSCVTPSAGHTARETVRAA